MHTCNHKLHSMCQHLMAHMFPDLKERHLLSCSLKICFFSVKNLKVQILIFNIHYKKIIK